jgi:hypothetical protein
VKIVWGHLRVRNVVAEERVKVTYLKKVLQISKFTLSHLAYLLAIRIILIENSAFA